MSVWMGEQGRRTKCSLANVNWTFLVVAASVLTLSVLASAAGPQ